MDGMSELEMFGYLLGGLGLILAGIVVAAWLSHR